MDENFLKNIRAKIKETPALSVAGLASVLDKSEAQTYRILNGHAPYKSHYTRILREYVGIGTHMDREGNTMAAIDLVDLKTVSSLEQDGDVICRITLPESMFPAGYDAKTTKLVKVTGDHCAPDYCVGDYVFVNTANIIPEPPGTFLLWTGMGFKLQFGEHIFGSDPVEIRLSSTNPLASYAAAQVPLNKTQLKGRIIGKISISRN